MTTNKKYTIELNNLESKILEILAQENSLTPEEYIKMTVKFYENVERKLYIGEFPPEEFLKLRNLKK